MGSSAGACARPNSVCLKNETCDPAHPCISATMGLVTPASLWGVASASATRSGLAPHWWISSGFASPSTRMGPPLTESPGRCRVHERGRAGSLIEANTTACCVERVLKGGRERCAASGAGRLFCRAWRASGSAQRSTLAWATGKALRMGPRGRRLGGSGCTGTGPGLEGQVTTATPFAPLGAWPGRPSGSRSWRQWGRIGQGV